MLFDWTVGLKEVKVTGNFVNSDKFAMTFVSDEEHWLTVNQSEMLAVYDIEPSFNQSWDGLLGLGPLANLDANDRKKSFLWRLKEDGRIDNLIVSVYLRERASNFSSVKFGSWDPSATENGKLNILETVSIYEWALKVKNFQINNGTRITDERKFLLSYQLPYLYLPNKEFDQYIKDI